MQNDENQVVTEELMDGTNSVFERSLFGYKIHITPSSAQDRASRIAVVVMHQSNMWTRRATKGFVASLCNSSSIAGQYPMIDVFSAEGSIEYLSESVVGTIRERQNEYAMIVTIGTWCSRNVKKLFVEMGVKLPIVFVGVKDPVESGIVDSYEAQGENICGVSGTPQDYAQQIRILKSIKPNVKKVMLPFDPNYIHSSLQEEYDEITRQLHKNNIEVVLAPILDEQPIREQLEEKLDGADTIISMREATMQAHAKTVIKFCNEKDITLFASELASVFQGAVIGFGDSGTVFGIHGARIAQEILQGFKTKEADEVALDMPVYRLEQPGVLRINPKVIGKQGLHLSEDQVNLIQHVIPLGWE